MKPNTKLNPAGEYTAELAVRHARGKQLTKASQQLDGRPAKIARLVEIQSPFDSDATKDIQDKLQELEEWWEEPRQHQERLHEVLDEFKSYHGSVITEYESQRTLLQKIVEVRNRDFKGLYQTMHARLKSQDGLLGGSGVVMRRVISPLIWVISLVTLLIILLITTHDPPSKHPIQNPFWSLSKPRAEPQNTLPRSPEPFTFKAKTLHPKSY